MNLRQFFTTHTWWGKILGGFFGYLILGSVGALFGVLIGNFFDKAFATYFSNPHLPFHMERRKTVQNIFFESTFLVMGHIAKADGRVSEQEINIAKILMHEMGLNRAQKDRAKELFNAGKLPTFNLNHTLNALKNACNDNRELLKLFIDIQYRAAKVDSLSTPKIHALNTVLSGLDFAPLHQQYRFHEEFTYDPFQEQTQQHKGYQRYSSSQKGSTYQQSQSSIDHAFALLEIDPSANKQEVKRAYRQQMSRNHPDKLIAKGLPQEMIRIANEKTQKILKAYELICKNKGW